MILDDEDKLEDAFIFHLPVKRQRSGMPTNVLVVGPKVAKPEDLNVLEEAYRRNGPGFVVEFDDDEPAGE